jgi:hypothetical protein
MHVNDSLYLLLKEQVIFSTMLFLKAQIIIVLLAQWYGLDWDYWMSYIRFMVQHLLLTVHPILTLDKKTSCHIE